MKKGLMIICILLAINTCVNAQTSSMTVINNTSCDVWYTLKGNTTHICLGNNTSPAFIVTAGNTNSYGAPPSVPVGSLGANAFYTDIKLYNVDPVSIPCTLASVGVARCHTPATHYTSDPTTCSTTCPISATWSEALNGTGGYDVTVTIN